jgi:hypothetical protein
MNRCETCGKNFELRQTHRSGRFCSLACYHAVGPGGRGPRTEVTKGPRTVAVPGHPIAPPSGVTAESRVVLYDKIGPGAHQCHWCGEEVAWIAGGGPATPNTLIVDHLDWDFRNNDPANLVSSCNKCNAHRTRSGDRRRLEEEETIVVWSGVPTRAVERECEYCGSAFLIPPSATKRGRGRFCSRSCARRKR